MISLNHVTDSDLGHQDTRAQHVKTEDREAEGKERWKTKIGNVFARSYSALRSY